VVGVNHFTWFTSATWQNRDLFKVYDKFIEKYYESGYNKKGLGNWMNDSFATDAKVRMDLFKRFGFASGRDTDKFEGIEVNRAANGLAYVTDGVNSFITVDVTEVIDMGTHSIFIGDVTEAKVISDDASATYDYYQKHIKPAPAALEEQHGWVCKVCGYVYEGEELPADYVCPLCKHGPEAFEKI